MLIVYEVELEMALSIRLDSTPSYQRFSVHYNLKIEVLGPPKLYLIYLPPWGNDDDCRPMDWRTNWI